MTSITNWYILKNNLCGDILKEKGESAVFIQKPIKIFVEQTSTITCSNGDNYVLKKHDSYFSKQELLKILGLCLLRNVRSQRLQKGKVCC